MLNLTLLANWAQIISLLVAVVAIAITLQQNRQAKHKRTITYIPYRVSSPFVIGAGKTLENDLDIRYKGKEIKNLHVMQARLENTSNTPLRRAHIVDPITFTFAADTELLALPQVVDKSPTNLELNWRRRKPNEVCLYFDLLNPDDEFTVEFVWSGQKEKPKVTARIEGINTIYQVEAEQISSRMIYGYLMQFFILLIILGVLIGIPTALLVGGGLVTNILSPKDFFVGISTGVIISGLIGFTSTQIRRTILKQSNIP